MTLQELRNMTRAYARDTNSFMFTNDMVDMFINQAIDRLKHEPIFKGMVKLRDSIDSPILLPEEYHYMLALFSASRCLEFDERFYEATEKRNEFESLFTSLMAEIEAGNLTILDSDGNEVENTACYIDYVVNEYFDVHKPDRDVIKAGE